LAGAGTLERLNDWTNQRLLQEFANRQSDAAFAELVRRHIDLVHSAALRMVCDSHLAQDVTQATFVALAQSAKGLTEYTVLSGWLHRTAQNLAAKAVRTDVRRRVREQEAAAMNELLSESHTEWQQVAPHLDAGLGGLSEADRDAVILRYFERKSAQEMAHVLGITAEAAQKRVNRAVERLREFFQKRGVTVGASGFVALVSANAVQAVPAALLATVSAAALSTVILTTPVAVTATKVIAMTALQKTIIGATLAVAVGAGFYKHHEASNLRNELNAVRAKYAADEALSKAKLEETATQLAALQGERERASSNASEVLRLRGEVARLLTVEQDLRARTTQNPHDGRTLIPASADIAPNDLPVETWSNAGFATPRDSLRTRGWAVLNGDHKRFKESIVITDGARKFLEDMFIQSAKDSTDPNKDQFLQETINRKFGVEDAILMPMMAQNRSRVFTGYKILEETSRSADETIMVVETGMNKAEASKEPLKFKRFGNDWKVVIDEDFVKDLHPMPKQ
jgi:RNA polymerase sigma factor (sigma-70 family)